jgi:hypothetical protein
MNTPFSMNHKQRCCIAASPADTRFLSLKQHPESHPNRYPGMENGLDVFRKWYNKLWWTCPARTFYSLNSAQENNNCRLPIKQSNLPGIIENCESAVSGSSISSCCKEPYVHAVTRKNWRGHHSLWSAGTSDSKQKLVFLIPISVVEE